MSGELVGAVGKCIRDFRTERGLTQEELADLAGLDRSYVSGVERATRNVTLQSLEHIVYALGIDLPTFFTRVAAKIDDLSSQQAGKYNVPITKK